MCIRDSFQGTRVALHALEGVAQFIARILRGDERLAQARGKGGKARVERGDLFQSGGGAAQKFLRATRALIGELIGFGERGADVFGVFKDGGAALQFFFFAGTQFCRRDLGKAALDLGKFALAALRVFQRGLDLSRQLHARAISRANGAHARKMILAAVGVEEAKVLFRVEKRLMFMLSVDVHEQGREALERCLLYTSRCV